MLSPLSYPSLEDGPIRAYKLLDSTLFIDTTSGTGPFTSDPLALHGLAQCLPNIREFYGFVYARRADGSWVRALPQTILTQLAPQCLFARANLPLPDKISWSNSALERGNVAAAFKNLVESDYFRPISANDRLSYYLSSAGIHPICRGRLKHPVHPSGPIDKWVTDGVLRIVPARPPYKHLQKLFSSWDLSPLAHCVLYSYIFGAFHAISLNEPRPLLWADSREQGVGKSLICEGIAELIDGEAKTMSLDADSNASEEIVARLVSGDRCLVIPNLSHRRNYNNILLATLCTDRGQSRRPKYGAGQTTFYGILGLSSAVLGSVTMHRDLQTRIWRVELPGGFRPHVNLVPSEYINDHRIELYAEILGCHAAAIPYTLPPVSRFSPFEKAALGAYAAFTGLPPEAVRKRMEAAIASSQVYEDKVMHSLFRQAPHLFVESFSRWPIEPPASKDSLKHFAGATAHGFVLDEKGEWHEATCP